MDDVNGLEVKIEQTFVKTKSKLSLIAGSSFNYDVHRKS